MRTSLNDIKDIEAYLEGKLSADEMILFEEKLQADGVLRLNVFLQRKVYQLLKLYRRRTLKAKVLSVHDRYFHEAAHSDFRNTILKIFKS